MTGRSDNMPAEPLAADDAEAERKAVRLVPEPLGAADLPALRALLTRDVAQNLYLLGLLEELGIVPRPGAPLFRFFGQRAGAGLSSALFVGGEGGLLVPSANAADLAPLLNTLRTAELQPLTVLGEKAAVDRVVRALGPRTVRMDRTQRLLVVSADDLGPFTNPALRLAREEDLPRLVPLAAQAVEALRGERPLVRDPLGFTDHVLRRVRASRTYVLDDGGELVFKVDVGARSEQGAELEGLFTAPGHRHRHHATLSLGQVCRQLLSSLPRLAIRVDDSNTHFTQLAQKVGFVTGRIHRLVVAG